MRRWMRLLPALALSVAVCGTACAQGAAGARGQGFGGRGQGLRGGFGPGGFGGGMMLMIPDVQTELKLTDAQKAQVRDAMQKMQTQIQGLGQRIQNATPEERAQMIQKMQADMQKAFSGILTPDQEK